MEQKIKLQISLTRRGNICYVHAEYNNIDQFFFVFFSCYSEAEEEKTLCHQTEDRRQSIFLIISRFTIYFYLISLITLESN